MTQRAGPYRAQFDSRARQELQYRAAALAGLFTQVVFGFIILMTLLAFYGSSEVPSPLTAVQTAAYVWMAQALLGLMPWNVDPIAQERIRTGAVALDLLRPVGLYGYWYAGALAWRTVRTALRFVPMLLLAGVVFPYIGLQTYALPAPVSATAGAWFVCALVLSALLSTAVTMLMQVAMMWTVSPDGVLRIVPAVAIVLSGGLVPLPLFPEWLQPFLEVQPLRGLIDTPTRLYSGDLVGAAAASALMWSAGWVVVLVGLGRLALSRGVRRLVVAGG